ncbi:MAG: AAA family ATPase [Flavobacteriales bacterium]|nr:AAA family ATPase [Flavobacteriales bacterium]
MKIKNIRNYRSLYKSIRPVDQNLNDEHFIGSFHDQKSESRTWGWFNIYHGDKEGIGSADDGMRNFLQSFLDMAKDGQAVYEFLQNAVDAGANHFTMAWGKDEDGHNYVLVANNGAMFDSDSIRSILNVGSSTKTSDTRNIGKFGIGFKLAHRLVGRDNGLDELFSDNASGPILFSWTNGEIEELANGSLPEPVSLEIENDGNSKFTIKDLNPWLFKILITCFPALPENDFVDDRVALSAGLESEKPVFSKSEYEALVRWVKKYKDVLSPDLYKQGSVFFIRLGAGKENDLADKNLGEGVRFSLAILQETAEDHLKSKHSLKTVQLNREKPIEKPDLEYLLFYITKSGELEEYLYIRFGVREKTDLTADQLQQMSKESDIEVLFGFRPYDQIESYFRGAPNFYLYFPLSEEVHNFNFVLHSNAFYKASSRTFLHKGSVGEDGINERLLNSIAVRLEKELLNLYDNGEKGKFLNLYAALLTSTESQNQDRLWVKRPFIDEITRVLKKLVPVRSDFKTEDFNLSDGRPRIKKTAIELPAAAWGANSINWFYWNLESPMILHAANFKLDPLVMNVLTVFRTQNISNEVNKWLEEDPARVSSVLKELSDYYDAAVIRDNENIKENLKGLKVFEFGDGALLSDNELQEDPDKKYIILFNKLKQVEPELQKSGLNTSVLDFDDFSFIDKYAPYLSSDSQLRGHDKLIEIISKANTDELTNEERIRIFDVFRKHVVKDKLIEKLGELSLFANKNGDRVKLKQILRKAPVKWLERFELGFANNSSELDKYLLSEDRLIYENVIYQFWPAIIDGLAQMEPSSASLALSQIREFYILSDRAEDEGLLLSNHQLIVFNRSIIKTKRIFCDSSLTDFQRDEYNRVQTSILSALNLYLPDYTFIEPFNFLPFDFDEPELLSDRQTYTLGLEDAIDVLTFLKIADGQLLNQIVVAKTLEGQYELSISDVRNYYTEDSSVVTYVERYHDSELRLLPPELADLKESVGLSQDQLYNYIIQQLDTSDDQQTSSAIQVVEKSSSQTVLQLFQRIQAVKLDSEWRDSNLSESKLSFLRRVMELASVTIEQVREKIVIENVSDSSIQLSSIDAASDSVSFNYDNHEVSLSRSKLLGLDDGELIPQILDYSTELVSRGCLTQNEVNQLFRITSSGITDELLTRFREVISDGKLHNGHQLILVCFSDAFKDSDLKGFHVLAKSGEWFRLEDNWILSECSRQSLYNPKYVLDDAYAEISTLLNIPVGKPALYNGPDESSMDNLLGHRFLFCSGANPSTLNPEADKQELLGHLFESWKITSKSIRQLLPDERWKDVLGFNPLLTVLDGYALEEEQLDAPIADWLKNQTEKRFIGALGISTAGSPIYNLREWLANSDEGAAKNFELGNISSTLLRNTLVGFAEQFTNESGERFHWKYDSPQDKLISGMLSILLESDEEYDVRVPVWAGNGIVSIGSETNGLPFRLNESDQEIFGLTCNEESWDTLINMIDVVVSNPEYQSFVDSVFPVAQIDYEISNWRNADEHNEPFYKTWSDEHDIRLFRLSQLEYNAYCVDDEDRKLIGSVSHGQVEVFKEDDITEVYYRSNQTLEQLLELLKERGESVLSNSLQDLINSRNDLLTTFYNTIMTQQPDGFQDEDSRKLMEAIQEKSVDEKRKEIVAGIKEQERYSYDWFVGYLEYLMTFEELSDTTAQRSISFQKIEDYVYEGRVSEKYFVLKAANSLIPVNIEAYTDFRLSLTFRNGKKEAIEVEGVSKKGQDLLTYCPSGVKKDLRALFSDAVNVRISFSPSLNLVERLYKSFTNEDIITPYDSIQDILPAIHFIYGPPGTGKTTRLTNLLSEKQSANPLHKSLVLVPTNKAGDVIAKKLIDSNPNIDVVRIGTATDPEIESKDPEIYQAYLDHQRLDAANVVISTVHRVPYYQISDEHGVHYNLFDKSRIDWDLVIFDESSMISLPHITFALLALNPKGDFIVAGDPKQIPPVVDTSDKNLEELEVDDENIYKMLKIDSFDRDEQEEIRRECDTIENLSTQYRSVEEIGTLFGAFSYLGLLKNGRDLKKHPRTQLPEGFHKSLYSPVSMIDIPVDLEYSIHEPKKLLYSPYHVYAGILTSEMIKKLDTLSSDDQHYTIGVVSPYKAQAMLVGKLVVSSGISKNISVYCDTVHGFQGDECDIVIFVINPNQTYYTGHKNALLTKEYIYNVAMSRARDYLWILCPYKTIKKNPHVNEIQDILGSDLERVDHTSMEKSLFGQPDFILNNSYLTGHDNINVFGQVDMKYFIKAGNTAIDIQLRS